MLLLLCFVSISQTVPMIRDFDNSLSFIIIYDATATHLFNAKSSFIACIIALYLMKMHQINSKIRADDKHKPYKIYNYIIGRY